MQQLWTPIRVLCKFLFLIIVFLTCVSAQESLSTPPPTRSAAPKESVVPANSANASSSTTTEAAAAPVEPTIQHNVVLDYVKSDIKWQLGFRHEPYNKISGFTMDHLSKALEANDLRSTTHIDEGCCKVMLELLQVSTRQAIIKDPGIDVAANIIVTDAKGKMVFSKGYRGRSGTHFMNTWGHLIDSACENLVDNIAKDDVLVAVLRTGKLPD